MNAKLFLRKLKEEFDTTMGDDSERLCEQLLDMINDSASLSKSQQVFLQRDLSHRQRDCDVFKNIFAAAAYINSCHD